MSTTPWGTLIARMRGELSGCPDFVIQDAIRASATEFCERTDAWRFTLWPIYAVDSQRDYSFDYVAPLLGEEVLAPWAKYFDSIEEIDAVSGFFVGADEGLLIEAMAATDGFSAIHALEGVPQPSGCLKDENAVKFAQAAEDFKTDGYTDLKWRTALIELYADCVGGVVAAAPQYQLGGAVHNILSAVYYGNRLEAATEDQLLEDSPTWADSVGHPRYYTRLTESQISLVPAPSVPEGTSYELSLRVSLKPLPDSTGIDSDIYSAYSEIIRAGALVKLFLVPEVTWSNPQLASFYAAKYEEGIISATDRSARGAVKVRRLLHYGGL